MRIDVADWLPHINRDRRGRHSLKLFEAHKDEFTMTVHADWAAQPEVPRGHNATCASKATVNLLVIVVGYLPYEKTFTQRTRRGFVSEEETARKQRVDVFYVFHPTDYRPDARAFNTVLEDITLWYRTGRVQHGEYILERERLPGSRRTEMLPDGFRERTPQMPEFLCLAYMLLALDGCAAQFSCATNHHQTAEWEAKTAASIEAALSTVRVEAPRCLEVLAGGTVTPTKGVVRA
jgi:hypothetical protein